MAQVVVARDRLSATLHLAAGEVLTLDALRAQLAGADVHHGLDRAALVAAISPAPIERELTLATGEAPHPGGDDAVDHLVDAIAPAAGDGRRASGLHRPRWLVEVPAGAELARVHPGRPPQPGRDVAGVEIPARPGNPVDLAALVGEGVALRPGDPPTLVATRAGAYARDAAGRIQVRCPLVIPGNLDHACGDLETSLPVTIAGDVTAGFTLVSGADVKVGGTVEDARVQIAGSLTVGGGIVAGRQRVTVHGRLIARHVMARPVRAQAIVLGGAAVDAKLVVAESLSCTVLVGGSAFVGGQLVCDQLGDQGETATFVELGGAPFLAALAHEATAERATLESVANHLRERVHLLQHHVHQVLSEDGLEDAAAATEELREAEQRLAASEAAAERCRRLIARHDLAVARGEAALASARLVVRKRVHAGVTIAFGTQRMVIEAEAGPSTFRLVEGAVVRE